MPIRFIAGKIERFFVYRVLSLNDTPHRIALGVAIGIFVTWTPTIGAQMALTVALCLLLRANKFVGVPFVWISNPATIVPIYGPNYVVGCWLLGEGYKGMEALREAMSLTGGLLEWLGRFWWATRDIIVPLWLGSLIVGLVLGVISYVAIYLAVINFRRQRQRLREALRARRAARAASKRSE